MDDRAPRRVTVPEAAAPAREAVPEPTRAGDLDLVRAVALAANTSWAPAEAFDVAVQVVCDYARWPVGVAWLIEDPGQAAWLLPQSVHIADERGLGELREAIRPLPAAAGGVLGAVVTTGSPASVWHVTVDEHPLSQAAERAGLDTAAVFSVVVGGRVAGLLQFFLPRDRGPDASLTTAMETVSIQLARVLERSRAEADLRARESEVRNVIEYSVDAYLALDREARVRDCNSRAQALFGHSREQLLERTLTELLTPATEQTEDALGLVTATAEAATSTGQRRQLIAHRRGGQQFPVEVTLWLASQQPLRISALVRALEPDRDAALAEGGRAGPPVAAVDPLTAVGTREGLLAVVERQLAGGGTGPVVAAVDLDQLGEVNDELGLAAGDAVLREIAARLTRLAGEPTLVGRVGGDEFALVFTPAAGTDIETLEQLGHEVLETVREPVRVDDGQPVRVEARVGLAAAAHTETREARILMHAADTALRTATRRGPGTVEVFVPEVHRAPYGRRRLEAELREALTRDQFEVHYQPLVELATGRLTGVEALVRWRHPERGLVGPYEFIAVAERAGLIVDLGRTVLRQACQQLSRWRDHTDRQLQVGVNLSAAQLDPTLTGTVERTLSESGLPPDHLVLEVTETLLGQDTELAPRLAELHELGVHLAVDDFGTGYSSLGRLSAYPFDVLKIDRSFIADIQDFDQDLPLVRAIAELAQALDMQIVAEGVETPAQLAATLRYGCTAAQGYLFAPALPPDDLERLLTDPTWDPSDP